MSKVSAMFFQDSFAGEEMHSVFPKTFFFKVDHISKCAGSIGSFGVIDPRPFFSSERYPNLGDKFQKTSWVTVIIPSRILMSHPGL